MRWLDKVIHALDKVGVFSRWTSVIGVALLFLMVAWTFIDVIMRYVFNRPFQMVLEVTEVMMICAIFLSLAHTQNEKAHIRVDLITSKLSPKGQMAMEFATTLLGLGITAVLAWRGLVQLLFFVDMHTMHSSYFPIPSAPFAGVIVLGCSAFCLLMIRDLLRNIAESVKLSLTRFHWLLMLGAPILVIVLAAFWMQPALWHLSLPIVGIIGVTVSVIFMLSGMPIAFALILTSLLFIGHIRGPNTAFDMVGVELYRITGSYNWAVLPFFVLMGYFCLFANFGRDLYLAAYRWFGHLRGGLSVATIGACTAFAAIVGDPTSCVLTMGPVCLPEMRKYNYDNRLSTGSIAGGSTLGPIIPPSGAFILVGLLTGLSIGDLFVAGIIPGLILASAFVLTISIWCRINPKMGPPGEKSGWGQRFLSLRAGGPVAILFLIVIGGIYLGVYTPCEGGAVGAVGALILGLVMKRFTWKSLTHTLQEAGKIISVIFLIIIGAIMFTRFMGWCNLSGITTELIARAGLSPTAFVLIVLGALFILGIPIEELPLILIGIPILYPIAKSLGIDPIWFVVLVVMTINLAGLTPPVGIILFALKGMAKDIPMGAIFTGAWPFVLASIAVIAIVFFVPSVATWLPGVLK